MSWNASITEPITVSTLEEKADEAWAAACDSPGKAPYFSSVPDDQRIPAREAFEAGIRAIERIIESGAVGSPAGQYRVSLSGHANPSHVPTPGWANDFLNITITQA